MLRAALIKLFLRCLALPPLRVVHALGAGLGTLFWIIPTRLQKVARCNLERCFPALSPNARETLLRRALIESGKSMAEVAPVWFWPKERTLALVRQVSGAEDFFATLAQGKGAIMAIPHLGCWEIVGQYVSARQGMTALYRPPRVAGIETMMVAARGRFGAQSAPTTAAGVRALYHALEHGQCVAILPDQDPSGGNGVFAPFFGVSAFTMTLLSRLARKYDAPVFYTYAERLPHGQGFHLHFVRADQNVAHANLTTAVTHLNHGVEACIKTLPEQYQWGYKRFKTRPEGEAQIY